MHFPNTMTLCEMLEQRALETPTRPFIVMDGDDSRTYGAFNEEVNRVAHGLAATGVRRGDRVALMLTNRLEYLLTSFALRKLGAVEVGIHTRTRGPGLVHVLRTATPRMLITESAVAGQVIEVLGETGPLDLVLVDELDAARSLLPGGSIEPFSTLVADREDNLPTPKIVPTDLSTVLFTSGTTGPSKGCMLSHRYGTSMGTVIASSLGFTEDDCLYCPFPASHVDLAFLTVAPALVIGGRAAIGRRFSVSRYWDEIRAFEATVFDFMGATLTMLWNQPERPDDADNPVRLAWGAPVPDFGPRFEERFDLQLVMGYGSTDAGIVAWNDPNAREPEGSCGRAAGSYELRIANDFDDPVPVGEVGEILVRSSEAGTTMNGYYGMAEETNETFRNMWLHTGDYGHMDGDGFLYFEGRKSDSIRRRGENISAWEIEQVLESHPDVLEAAAVGVASTLSEEDVKAFVVLRAGATLSADELTSYVRPKMADFMVPEFIEFLEEIPKTDTGKPEKFRLV